jgi:hypothetical protein
MKTNKVTESELLLSFLKKKDAKQRLKNVSVSILLLVLFFIFNTETVFAQNDVVALDNINLNVHLKNMHLWQGYVVTPGVMVATSMEYVSDDNKYVAGLWGGASFDGSYTEFSYYATYNFTKNIFAQLISHNNYSGMVSPDMFSYDKYTSPNFLDVLLSYTISDNLPLNIMTSTILFGQAGDYETDDDGSDADSYSTYVEMSYSLFRGQKTKIKASVGGAFSLFYE